MSGTVAKRTLSPLRMDSCVADPHQELLVVFKERNLRVFVDLLGSEGVDVNLAYPLENHKTLLQLAVEGSAMAFVQELLRHPRVDPNLPDQVRRKFPLHSASEQGQVEMVRLLLAKGADPNVRAENGDTPLHLAALLSGGKGQAARQADMQEVVQLLLNQDSILYDISNNIGLTPLYNAAEKGSEAVVRLLLQKGACLTTKVDRKTAEDWINKRMPGLLDQMNTTMNRQSRDSPEAVLFKTLYYQPTDFKAELERLTGSGSVNLDADDGSYTLLQYCCDLGYAALVDALLAAGADPNHVSAHNKMPPVVWAAHHGYHLILRIFKCRFLEHSLPVDFTATDEVRKETVFHKVLKAESKAYSNREQRDYSKCLKLLLDDESVRFQHEISGAVNAQDNLGNTPLHLAAQLGNHDAVRKLLRSEANLGLKNWKEETPIVHIAPDIMEEYLDDCLEGEELSTSDKFKITFKYHFLGPPRMKFEDQQPLLEGKEVDVGPRKELPETEPLWYMSQIPEHRHLMSHPTITSFLWMKWRKIRQVFYLNLAFYFFFVAFLTSYVILVNMKEGEERSTAEEALYWTSFALLVGFTLREVFQLALSYRRYLFNLENLMELALIGLSFTLLLGGLERDSLAHRHISGLVILLSWAEGVILIGTHPRLSTYITMFREVSYNFSKFLVWFILLIIAFGLCFFIIFQRKGEEKDGEEVNAHFLNPRLSLMKTIIISLTGEIEFEGIDFNESEFSRIIFLIYVFFIMLVLVNLLNGLAVSDIATIQKQSEIMSHISRVELMCQIESVLLGDPFHFLTNFPESGLARKLPDCNLLASLCRKVFGLFGSSNFLLFSSRLKQKKAVFFPNKSKKEQSGSPDERNDLVLSNQILDAAKGLLVRKATLTDEEEARQRLAKMERALAVLADQQNHILAVLNSLTK